MKILIGGSPCTHWSIAQTKNRETEASGIGWELFLNYRIARDKYQPDFFLYENNKSMSPAIRAQITAELGVEPVLINSALVSAQNRQRLYWVGRRNPDGTYSQVAVEQPADCGIILRDILESGVCWKEKGYAMLSTTGGTTVDDMVSRHQRNGAAEPVAIKPLTEKEMDYMVRETTDGRNHFAFDYFHDATQEKSACVTANTHKDVPYNILVGPVRIGTIENDAKNQTFDSQQYRVYSPDAKSVTLCGNGGGLGAKTGLYAVPVIPDGKGQFAIKAAGGKEIPVYEVRGGRITIKGKTYPIKLADGFYIIRKLTVTECCRLQTLPDDYCKAVSQTQAYKGLGNGWTAEVIIHLLNHALKDIPKDEQIVVLSMYDGIGTGRYCLDKMGFTNVRYYAYEIDKYAIQTTLTNYPETVQLGDAFQVRDENWRIPNETI